MDFDGSLLVREVLGNWFQPGFRSFKGVVKPVGAGLEGGDQLSVAQAEKETETGTPGHNAGDMAEALIVSQEQPAPEIHESRRAEILGGFIDQLALRPAMESLVLRTDESVGLEWILEASVALFYDKPVEDRPARRRSFKSRAVRLLRRLVCCGGR